MVTLHCRLKRVVFPTLFGVVGLPACGILLALWRPGVPHPEYPLFPATIVAGIATLVFYVTVSSILQTIYYVRQSQKASEWKVQSEKTKSFADSRTWWLPIYAWCKKPFVAKFRAARHSLLATYNVLQTAACAAFTMEMMCRQKTLLTVAPITLLGGGESESVLWVAMVTLCALAMELASEYYWHRVMHSPLFYSRCHKIHHTYKSPEPFDDFMIHPVEAFGFNFLLFAPPFLLPIHAYGFVAYFAVHGVSGVLDHSGVQFTVPNVYSVEDHDRHHSHFECNYGTPFPYMDLLHGTYRGTFLGKRYGYQGALNVGQRM